MLKFESAALLAGHTVSHYQDQHLKRIKTLKIHVCLDRRVGKN